MWYRKHYFLWLFTAILSIICSWMLFIGMHSFDQVDTRAEIEKTLEELIEKQASYADVLQTEVAEQSSSALWSSTFNPTSDFLLNITQADTLVFWNNNMLPLEEVMEANWVKSSSQVLRLSNGYYLVTHQKKFDLNLYVSTKLQHDYYFENDDLQNKLTDWINIERSTEFSLQPAPGFQPISHQNETLFYVKFDQKTALSTSEELLIFVFYALGYVAAFIALGRFLMRFTSKQRWLIFVFPVAILTLRFMEVHLNWTALFANFELFDPNLYASSVWFPNLGSLVLTLLIIVVAGWWILTHLKKEHRITKYSDGLYILLYLALFPFSYFVSVLFESLVLNSSISLVIDEVFSLSIHSLIALLVPAALFLLYYLLARRIIEKLIEGNTRLTTLTIIWFLSSSLYFLLEIFLFQKNIYNALWPILLNALLFYIIARRFSLQQLRFQLLILAVLSFYGAFILFESNQSNEHQKRELYANQLISDQNPTMELEFQSTLKALKSSESFRSIVDRAEEYAASSFALALEECCFSDFWERYEMEYYFFDENGEVVVNYANKQTHSKPELDTLIETHTRPSEIADNLFYVEDYVNQLSYISSDTLRNKYDENYSFYILFRSKKIPEHIGFPRLLMNEKSYALDDLAEYSIARYSGDKLVMRFGNYNYPTSREALVEQLGEKDGFMQRDEMSHLMQTQGNDQVVVISKPQKRVVAKLTTFSYLFLFFGVFSGLVALIAQFSYSKSWWNWPLSFRIQLIMVGIAVTSFIIFAVVAGRYVKRQYNTYTLENLKERVASVETEVGQKLGDKDTLDAVVLGDYMNYILKKFSNVFVTDINLYAPSGRLLATSQPKLYQKGISSRQMNHNAFAALSIENRSEFVHRETMGELSYLSAYVPFENSKGQLLGHLNLQHFAKQNAFEKQINDFVVAIINIAVLLLVITVVIAIFVSGWITKPLRLIQESFRKVELGAMNQPIDYKGDDEIGALVKDYNEKLAELELKAMQLARSERETAWREMAKQVAHEIKNPLTPMRLSLQHFERSFSPDDPKAEEKIQKIATSLVEQIDALTKIANEFSNFAKMPKANEEELDLIPLLEHMTDLYASEHVNIQFSKPDGAIAMVFADKDLLVRVFNNLLKNAIQASEDASSVKIEIGFHENEQRYQISIKDHGEGIPSTIQNKIFVPNFTTKSTGTGLGLAMVKQIISNHNGEIWFDTVEGKGTTFHIELPKKGSSSHGST